MVLSVIEWKHNVLSLFLKYIKNAPHKPLAVWIFKIQGWAHFNWVWNGMNSESVSHTETRNIMKIQRKTQRVQAPLPSDTFLLTPSLIRCSSGLWSQGGGLLCGAHYTLHHQVWAEGRPAWLAANGGRMVNSKQERRQSPVRKHHGSLSMKAEAWSSNNCLKFQYAFWRIRVIFQKRTWSRQGELKTTCQEKDTYTEAHEELEDQLSEKVGACLEASWRSHTLSRPRCYKNSILPPPWPGSSLALVSGWVSWWKARGEGEGHRTTGVSLEAVSCPDLSPLPNNLSLQRHRPETSRARSILNSLKPWATINLFLTSVSYINHFVTAIRKATHGTCQLSIHRSPKHYLTRTSIAGSPTICKCLLKHS